MSGDGGRQYQPAHHGEHRRGLRRAILFTARLQTWQREGTAFYLGKINGRHLMASNRHLVPEPDCSGAYVSVVVPGLEGRSFECEKVFGIWNDIDLTIFSIQVQPEADSLLIPVARSFPFRRASTPGRRCAWSGSVRRPTPKATCSSRKMRIAACSAVRTSPGCLPIPTSTAPARTPSGHRHRMRCFHGDSARL